MKALIIRNTMGQAVGIYTPSTDGYYGVIELISDYAGIKHDEICTLVAPGDKNINTVTCNTNVNWLDDYIAHPPAVLDLSDNPHLIPVADSLNTYLTADEVCDMFKITRRTLTRWHVTQGLEPTKRGNVNLYPLRQINKQKKYMGMK